MSHLLYRLGLLSVRRRWVVLISWIVILVLGGAGAVTLSTGTADSFEIPGTESQSALDQVKRTFPQMSGAAGQILVTSGDSAGGDIRQDPYRTAIEGLTDDLSRVDHVASAVSPFSPQVSGQVNDAHDAAIIAVQFDQSGVDLTDETRDQIRDVVDAHRGDLPEGSQLLIGGEAFSVSVPGATATEAVGVIIAFLVLLLMLRSLLAASMPLITAVLGVGITVVVLYTLTAWFSITSTALPLALMIGLAVGIDYALFILSRHRDELAHGNDPEEAAARATGTAGSAVIFAGITVAVALLGLAVAGIPFLTVMGVTAAMAVVIAVAVSLTFTPALLGFAGRRITPKARRQRRRSLFRRTAQSADATDASDIPAAQVAPVAGSTPPASVAQVAGSTPPASHPFARRWIAAVTRYPLISVLGVVALLGAMVIPAAGLRLTLPNAGTLPPTDEARVTYDAISDHFGAGANGTLLIVTDLLQSTDPVGDITKVADRLRTVEGVSAVPLATPNATADTGIVEVTPVSGPSDEATSELVHRIRGLHDEIEQQTGLSISVTGFTAIGIDVSEKLSQALLPFGALVVGLCLLLLMVVFRSILVPLKAAAGYLLSLVAAFGATSAVFIHGFGAEALRVDPVGPVISFLPIIVMGVLFGLAMDYEVFLVSRIREDFTHTGDARGAITRGFVGSAQVVTAAAAIMFFVFAAFIPEGDSSIKPIALSLAVGVFADAFLVRMIFVPAVLALLGRSAWWLPAWLDRRLPHVDVEGEGLARELELREWPADSPDAVIAADHLTLNAAHDVVYRDVHLRVRPGELLVLEGPIGTGKSSLILTLSGRLPADSGALRVLGMLLPDRAATVRRRVEVLPLTSDRDPSAALLRALQRTPDILFIDDLDAIVSPLARQAFLDQLSTARREAASAGTASQGAAPRDRSGAASHPLTIVATCQRADELFDERTPGLVVTTLTEQQEVA